MCVSYLVGRVLLPSHHAATLADPAPCRMCPGAVMTLRGSCWRSCSVYKEKALGDADIDPVYMNGWVAVYQFLFSIPLLIPSAIASNVAIADLPGNLWNGLRCLAQVPNCAIMLTAPGGPAPRCQLSLASMGWLSYDQGSFVFFLDQADSVFQKTSDLTVDDCTLSPTYVSVYILFNLGYNVLIILILKYARGVIAAG